MSVRELPTRPHLDHLKHEAKALYRDWQAGDLAALRRVRDVVGDKPVRKLSDAQRVVAHEYGFPTWARLRAHVQSVRPSGDGVGAFLSAVQDQDAARARDVLHLHPHIKSTSLHVAATLGDASAATRLIDERPSLVAMRAGAPPADPLLFLCYSPFHGESAARDAGLLATARVLLNAGANPNTRDARYGVPALYAVTGLRSVLPIARLLLDAGANPTDGESIFHAAEHFHEEALELLLGAGADLNAVGEWGNTALYFLLRWWDVSREARVSRGLQWLLDHGADPNVVCAEERETALHVAVRRRQRISVIQLLLDHGADIHARRGDGSTAGCSRVVPAPTRRRRCSKRSARRPSRSRRWICSSRPVLAATERRRRSWHPQRCWPRLPLRITASSRRLRRMAERRRSPRTSPPGSW